MRKIKVGLDTQAFASKPWGGKIGGIKNRICNNVVELTVSELADYVSKGFTFCPAEVVPTPNDKGELTHQAAGWRSQQLFFVDIDNDMELAEKGADGKKKKARLPDPDYISEAEAMKICGEIGIFPCIVYHSFNYKPDYEKFRIGVAIDELITDETERERIITGFMSLFGKAADKSCKNADRIFFGSRADCVTDLHPDYSNPKQKFLDLAPLDVPKHYPSVLPAPDPAPAPSGGSDWYKEYDFDIDYLLTCIDPDTVYTEWVSATAAYRCAGGSQDVWEAWCRQSPKWNEKTDRKLWDNVDLGTSSRESLITLANRTAAGAAYIAERQEAQRQAQAEYRKKGRKKKKQEASSERHPFLCGEDGNRRINPVKLCDCYLAERHFLFARSENSKSIKRFLYKDGVYKWLADEDIKADILAYIEAHEAGEYKATKAINEVFSLVSLQRSFNINEEELNADENIINFENGILHLDTMELTEHSPEILSTIQLPCKWLGEQPTPVFDRYLFDFTSGDFSKQNALLEFMGGCISNIDGGRRFKKALFLVGEGDSGKSVLRNLVTELVGKNNQSGGSIALLEERFGAIELYQRRVYGSPDLGYLTAKQIEKFKNITGGDYIPLEQKNEPSFQYRYKGFVWFCSNELPKFPPDKATYNRMLLIKCSNIVPENKQDRNLIPKMLKEASGIVYKAIVAVKAALERGGKFTIPEESVELMKAYRVENSFYLQFYEECCEARPLNDKGKTVIQDNVTTAVIHQVCREWFDINVPKLAHSFSKSSFRRELTAENISNDIIKTRDNQYYPFTLTEQAKKEFHY